MFAVLSYTRKALRVVAAVAAAAVLAACEPISIGGLGPGPGAGRTVDASRPVQVALLVPRSDAGAAPVAQSLENAARLAIAEVGGGRIDLRVYDTAGTPSTAAAQAQRAVNEGAKIILGPLFGAAANSAGLAVLDDNVNVLSFSNNASIAGGNVFVLGPTFRNTANRLMSFARRQGRDSVVVVHANDTSGQFGRSAIEQAAASNGVRVLSTQAYPLSIEGVTATARSAGAAVVSSGAKSVFITTDASSAAMPTLLQTLPESGANPAQTQYIGLTRLDVRPDLFSLPGAQGAWFTLPNRESQASFEQRYRAAHGLSPHPLAGLAYDGISAIAALLRQGRNDALTGRALTRSNGFTGTGGIFRLMPNGSNQRALAVAAIQNNQVVILDPAPNGFGGAGF
ncbi:MAG: penicillin-binding protein activator [Paracoccaceae bacterium]|nr:penicillin-binding protein activator [Paracoccaceae bacterium]